MIERFIENDQFNDYLKAKFGNIRPTSKSGSYDYACGMDSCAFFYTKDYLGIPIYFNEKNKMISLEHTHPLQTYILTQNKYKIIKKLKENAEKIIS